MGGVYPSGLTLLGFFLARCKQLSGGVLLDRCILPHVMAGVSRWSERRMKIFRFTVAKHCFLL
jgi:hypothetical protein